MAYEHFIGSRYLMAKRRSSVVSVITLIAIAGVALGVTAMIVVLSVMGGFKSDLKEKILGTKAHIVVKAEGAKTLKEPERVLEIADDTDGVVGAAPYLHAEVMASSPTNLSGIQLRGIDPERIGEVSELDTSIERGEMGYLEDPGPLLDELSEEREKRREVLDQEIDIGGDEGGAGGSGADAPGAAEPGESLPVPETTDPPGEGSDEPVELDHLEGEAPPIPEGSEKSGETEGPGDQLPSSGDDESKNGEGGGESAMPAVAPDDGADADERDEADGGMPAIAPGSEGGESQRKETNAEMPSVAGGEEGDEPSGMPPIADDEPAGEEATGEMPSVAEESDEEGRGDLPGLLIGKELANSLQVELGDEINVVTPQGEMGPTGPVPRSRPFRIVGVFYTGMYEYDSGYAYTTLEDARSFLGEEGVTGVEVKTETVERAEGIGDELQARVPDRMDVQDWKEMNRSLFYALKLEKVAMFVVLTFIILVASFSIIAMLIMIVLEKKRDISVLKSMGMSDWGIMRIFIYQGVVIGGIGAIVGLVFGLYLCFVLMEVGFPLNSEVYYISKLPVEVRPFEVFLVVGCTILISFVATLYPSYKAAQLEPVEGLRYE